MDQIHKKQYNGLANRRLQPLGHLSGAGNAYIIVGFSSNRIPQIPHMHTNKVGLARTTKGNRK